jgi:hypothetical protein
LCTAVLIGCTSPLPPHLGLYTRMLFVSQDRSFCKPLTAWFMFKKELISVTLKRTLKLKQYLKTIISVLCSHSVWKFIHRNRGRIFKELLCNKLRLSWGSFHGSYFSNIKLFRLTCALLSVPIYMCFKWWSTNQGGAFFWPIAFSHLCCDTQDRTSGSIHVHKMNKNSAIGYDRYKTSLQRVRGAGGLLDTT